MDCLQSLEGKLSLPFQLSVEKLIDIDKETFEKMERKRADFSKTQETLRAIKAIGEARRRALWPENDEDPWTRKREEWDALLKEDNSPEGKLFTNYLIRG